MRMATSAVLTAACAFIWAARYNATISVSISRSPSFGILRAPMFLPGTKSFRLALKALRPDMACEAVVDEGLAVAQAISSLDRRNEIHQFLARVDAWSGPVGSRSARGADRNNNDSVIERVDRAGVRNHDLLV